MFARQIGGGRRRRWPRRRRKNLHFKIEVGPWVLSCTPWPLGKSQRLGRYEGPQVFRCSELQKKSFYFVDPIAGRVVSVDLWSLERPCGSSGPLTFVHFESPDVRTALFCLPYTDRIVHFCCSDQNRKKIVVFFYLRLFAEK